MKAFMHTYKRFTDFFRNTSGLAYVEFAICLPMMILLFGMVIEGARIMWSFQNAISGVREASRYMSRVTSADICGDTAFFSGLEPQLLGIVQNRIRTTDSVFPEAVRVVDIDAKCEYFVGALRMESTPIAQLNAHFEITLPFSNLLSFYGGETAGTIDVFVADEMRAYGV